MLGFLLTCRVFTCSAAFRPVELRSMTACRRISSGSSFRRPTVLTLPFTGVGGTEMQAVEHQHVLHPSSAAVTPAQLRCHCSVKRHVPSHLLLIRHLLSSRPLLTILGGQIRMPARVDVESGIQVWVAGCEVGPQFLHEHSAGWRFGLQGAVACFVKRETLQHQHEWKVHAIAGFTLRTLHLGCCRRTRSSSR